MILGERFIVYWVYFSSHYFPKGLQAERFRDPRCFMQ